MTSVLERSGHIPILQAALGACFHLELLEPEDEARLSATHDRLLEWFGHELRWSLNARVGFEEPFQPADLQFVNAYPTSLGIVPVGEYPAENLFLEALGIHAQRRACMGLSCHGGEERTWASPYSYSFYADVYAANETEPQLITPGVLSFTVPETWPVDDFARRVSEIAGLLNVRWGTAGLTYSAWLTHFHTDAMRAMYAHARRFPGFDVGLHVAWLAPFYKRLRTVSWLTFLGAELQQELFVAGKGLPESDGSVSVTRIGNLLVLQAGAAPEPGDINRLRIPRAYARADEMVRPVRADRDIDFYETWTEATTTEWLRRFERRVF